MRVSTPSDVDHTDLEVMLVEAEEMTLGRIEAKCD